MDVRLKGKNRYSSIVASTRKGYYCFEVPSLEQDEAQMRDFYGFGIFEDNEEIYTETLCGAPFKMPAGGGNIQLPKRDIHSKYNALKRNKQ